jgi:hypothetical protein
VIREKNRTMLVIQCISIRNHFQMKSMKVIFNRKNIVNKEFEHDDIHVTESSRFESHRILDSCLGLRSIGSLPIIQFCVKSVAFGQKKP